MRTRNFPEHEAPDHEADVLAPAPAPAPEPAAQVGLQVVADEEGTLGNLRRDLALARRERNQLQVSMRLMSKTFKYVVAIALLADHRASKVTSSMPVDPIGMVNPAEHYGPEAKWGVVESMQADGTTKICHLVELNALEYWASIKPNEAAPTCPGCVCPIVSTHVLDSHAMHMPFMSHQDALLEASKYVLSEDWPKLPYQLRGHIPPLMIIEERISKASKAAGPSTSRDPVVPPLPLTVSEEYLKYVTEEETPLVRGVMVR